MIYIAPISRIESEALGWAKVDGSMKGFAHLLLISNYKF